jgi:hypothetical protein
VARCCDSAGPGWATGRTPAAIIRPAGRQGLATHGVVAGGVGGGVPVEGADAHGAVQAVERCGARRQLEHLRTAVGEHHGRAEGRRAQARQPAPAGGGGGGERMLSQRLSATPRYPEGYWGGGGARDGENGMEIEKRCEAHIIGLQKQKGIANPQPSSMTRNPSGKGVG